MAKLELNERKQRLLMALVERHIRHGQPVGSKTLATGSGLAVSPATIRNLMAELEDMVAQVDSELSYDPESVSLWGQRVNLMLDLAQIYQHQWEREYGRMASR